MPGLSNYEGLETFYHMVRDITGWMRARIAEGATLEQLQAEGVPERWEGYLSQNPMITPSMFIQFTYQGMAGP